MHGSGTKELVISYSAGGLPLADSKAMKWAEELAETFNKGTKSCVRAVSSAVMVDAVRLLTAKGILNHEAVFFLYEGKVIHINKYGMITDWPKGFCDSRCDILEELLTLAFKNRKEERNESKG